MLKPNFLYNSTIVILNNTKTNDHGSIVYTFASGDSVSCRSVQVSEDEIAKLGGHPTDTMYRFHCDPSTTVKHEDKVEFSGREFRIISINNHHNMSNYKTITATDLLKDE